jgi:hypothetical protein
MSNVQPSGECINAVLELQQAVSSYKTHGHGNFVWRAFVALRTAERHLIDHPGLAPTVAICREEVMAAVEGIARSMMDLGEVTSDGGRKQLLHALKWADKGAVSTAASEKRRDVVERLRIVFSMLLNTPDAKLSERPAWKDLKSFDGAFQMVADDTGESKSNVRKIWETETASGLGRLYARDAEAAIEKRKRDMRERRKPKMRASVHKPVKPQGWR